jgi:hypothetical protein
MPRHIPLLYRKYSKYAADQRSCPKIKELETCNRMDPWQTIISNPSANPSNC